MFAALIDRILTRMTDEEAPRTDVLEELLTTVTDRICLRLGADSLPLVMESIAVEATLKAYRRQYYEGIDKESIDGVSVSFIGDVLSEYSAEFDSYLSNKRNKVVRFL